MQQPSRNSVPAPLPTPSPAVDAASRADMPRSASAPPAVAASPGTWSPYDDFPFLCPILDTLPRLSYSPYSSFEFEQDGGRFKAWCLHRPDGEYWFYASGGKMKCQYGEVVFATQFQLSPAGRVVPVGTSQYVLKFQHLAQVYDALSSGRKADADNPFVDAALLSKFAACGKTQLVTPVLGLFKHKDKPEICTVTRRLVDAFDFVSARSHFGLRVPDEHFAYCVSSQVGEALALLHSWGWCHRDVSLENILLEVTPTNELRARLMDFGAARPLQWEGGGGPPDVLSPLASPSRETSASSTASSVASGSSPHPHASPSPARSASPAYAGAGGSVRMTGGGMEVEEALASTSPPPAAAAAFSPHTLAAVGISPSLGDDSTDSASACVSARSSAGTGDGSLASPAHSGAGASTCGAGAATIPLERAPPLLSVPTEAEVGTAATAGAWDACPPLLWRVHALPVQSGLGKQTVADPLQRRAGGRYHGIAADVWALAHVIFACTCSRYVYQVGSVGDATFDLFVETERQAIADEERRGAYLAAVDSMQQRDDSPLASFLQLCSRQLHEYHRKAGLSPELRATLLWAWRLRPGHRPPSVARLLQTPWFQAFRRKYPRNTTLPDELRDMRRLLEALIHK